VRHRSAAINSGLAGDAVYSLAIDPKTPTTIYTGTWGGGVYRSTDGGENWAAANSGLTIMYLISLEIIPNSPSILYAGTYYGGVYKSVNGGGGDAAHDGNDAANNQSDTEGN